MGKTIDFGCLVERVGVVDVVWCTRRLGHLALIIRMTVRY